MRSALAQWHELALILAVVIIIAAMALAWRFGRKKDSRDVERERRSYLNRVGRIVDGQVLEIVERSSDQDGAAPAAASRKRKQAANAKNDVRKMLLYTYSISGVTYEAAQDISGLEEQVCLDRVVAGQPVGVKYDPANPSNSILIADDWSGLN